MDIAKKALKKHGRGSQQATDALQELATLFMPIKLIPKQYDALVERVRSALSQIRAQERAIMQICVRDAPSIVAASSNVRGTPCSPARNK